MRTALTGYCKICICKTYRYVDSASNPADVADVARGSAVNKLIENETWISGPVFLLPESECPDNLIDLERLEVSDPEVKKGLEINSIQLKEEDDVITCLSHHFSSWFCLKKAVAWILRFEN